METWQKGRIRVKSEKCFAQILAKMYVGVCAINVLLSNQWGSGWPRFVPSGKA